VQLGLTATPKRKDNVDTYRYFGEPVFIYSLTVGVEELDQNKLTPLLRLKYHDSIADAVADLGKPDEIGKVFAGFQRYLYAGRV